MQLQDEGKALPKHWDVRDVLLYYKNLLYIPDDDALRTLIAEGCHDSKVVAHFGQEKTIEIITGDFYQKNLTAWIKDYVQSRHNCQQTKSTRHARYGLRQ